MDLPESNKVVLYYSNRCHHCISFLPEWEKLKSKLKKQNWEEYEESANPEKISEENIEAFPTIKITASGVTMDYDGERTADAILKVLSGGTQEPEKNITKLIQEEYKQCGGSKNSLEYYKMKYLKYKAKYMKLKTKLN